MVIANMMTRIGVIIDALEIIHISTKIHETYDYRETMSLDFLKIGTFC
jgi:hypothetical protein